MSVRVKLALSYLAIIVIFVGLGIYVGYAGRQVAAQASALDEQFETTAAQGIVLDDVAHLALAMQTSRLALHEMLLGEGEAQAEFEASIEEFDEHLGELVAISEAGEARFRATGDPRLQDVEAKFATLDEIEAQHEHFHEDAALIIEWINEGDDERALALLNDELDAEFAAIQAQLETLEEDAEQQLIAANTSFDESVHNVREWIGWLRNITVGLLILSVFAAAGLASWLSLLITRPVYDLSETAESIERGAFELERLPPLTTRRDEFGLLARVFQRMAEEVHAREQALKQQVRQLQIKIDRSKQDQQVAEITGSDFFQNLEAKAAQLRSAVAGDQ